MIKRIADLDAAGTLAMDGFARVNAGVTSPAEFFSDENVGRIVGAGPGAQA